MIRLLVLCLIWLSSVRCETSMDMHMSDTIMEDNAAMEENLMLKPKRESYHNPCPPAYSHPISYAPPPQIYIKPYVQPAHMSYVHQASYSSVIQKPMITYVKAPVVVKPAPAPVIVKPAPAPVIVKPVVQPKLVYPVVEKPMISYAPVYQKPVYYAPMYQKPMYEQPKVYVKKYEVPVTQVVQKPQLISYPVQYHQPKVVHVQPPQINYVKIAQPVHPQPVYQSTIKPWCP
ncbi:uncharacterized protein LOC143376694 [Andrena cerasifolii]|uniref:uncharacterized protein LOC143376694 n=1 Tax=Andrena cerasifolii TaxID=2819439 RepID=UPI0040379C09